MFRPINLKDKLDISINLYKNKDEVIANIPLEIVNSISYKLGEPSVMTIDVPKYIMKNSEKKLYSLYNKMKARQQIIISINGEKERYVIMDVSTKAGKRNGTKTFTAYSFEKTLDMKRISFEGGISRNLIKDDVYVHDGILDEVAKASGWKIGYVDNDAKTITQLANEIETLSLFNDYKKELVEKDKLIWSKSISGIVAPKDSPLNVTIDYIRLKSYKPNSDKELKNENIETKLKPYYTNITKIEAYYYSDVGNRYGLKYKITLDDGVEMEEVHPFTNLNNLKIECESINLKYETGNIVEGKIDKFIYVETFGDSILKFLNDMQEQFSCIFTYDTINKIINCHAKKNIGTDTPIILSYDNNVFDVTVTPVEEAPNSMLVMGNEGLGISDVNIYGGNKIYNYKYYIDNGLLSESVILALNKYDEILAVKQEEFYRLKEQLTVLNGRCGKIDSKVSTLEYRIKYLNGLLSGFIAVGEDASKDQLRVKTEIEQLESELNENIRNRNELTEQIYAIEDDIVNISNEIKKENVVDSGANKIFSDNDLILLNDIEECTAYEDNYYTTSLGLYTKAISVLEDKIKPQVDFSISCANLSKVIMNNNVNDIVKLGNFFLVDGEEIDEIKEEKVRLVGYTLVPKEKRISNVDFTNKELKIDNANIIGDIGKKSSQNTGNINKWKNVWEESMLSTNYVSELLKNGLDLATASINSKSSRNLLDFSEYGCYWKDSEDPTNGNQIYIGHSLIGVSTDGFKTSKVAISGDGVMAEVIIGKLLLGEKLEITTDDGRFTIGLNDDKTRMGLHVNDEALRPRIFLGLERDSNGNQIAKLELKDKTGTEVVLDENGIISEIQYCDRSAVDKDSPMYSYFRIQNNVNILKESILTIKLRPFRVYNRGMEGGGSYVSGVTSTSGGGYAKGLTSASGGSYYNNYAVTSTGEYWSNPFDRYMWTSLEYEYGEDGSSHYHGLDGSILTHTHNINFAVNVPSHAHTTNINIPSHAHTTNINIPNHTHEEKYGCFDLSGNENKPSNVCVKVNGNVVRENIDSDVELNITSYLEKNMVNEITIESDTRGQVFINLYNKSFVRW